MQPVSLEPDNTETGYTIRDMVEYQGVLQYVVTPKDNPSHRIAVRREDIRDWVSSKAHEDYDFARYKEETEEELEAERRMLLQAAEKTRKRAARAKARAMLNVTKPDHGRGSVIVTGSASELESDETSSAALLKHTTPVKRKLSHEDVQSPLKRQAVSSLSPGLTAAQKLLLQSNRHQLLALQDEPSASEEDEIPATDPHHETVPLSYRPILPPPKARTGSFTNSSAAKPLIPTSLSSYRPKLSVNPSSSTPEQRYSKLGPPVYVSVPIPKQEKIPASSSDTASNTTTPNQNYGPLKEYPPILPPPRQSVTRSSHSTTSSGSSSTAPSVRGVGKSQHSLSPKTSVSAHRSPYHPMTTSTATTARAKNNNFRPAFANGNASEDIGKQRILPIQTLGEASRHDMLSGGKNRYSKLSAGHAAVGVNSAGGQETQKSPKSISKPTHSQMNVEDVEEGEEGEEGGESSGETWAIHGLIDDELRLIDGDLVHHYRVDWVGDYSPTWEPEWNVSEQSIKAYRRTLERDRFDGAQDELRPSRLSRPMEVEGGNPVTTRHVNGSESGSNSEDFQTSTETSRSATRNAQDHEPD
jgi:hypothetical protein